MKIISIVGGRPNLIKLAAICHSLNRDFDHLILHTGQHYGYEMSESFFKELKLPKPNINLEVGSGTHARQVGKILVECEKYFLKNKPDLIVVYGDMNSTIGAALAASKLKISIAHVEAGIRSFDKTMPEEINRTATDHISDIVFSPTAVATNNLKNEGLKSITFQSGDTAYDTFLRVEKDLNEAYYQRLKLSKFNYYYLTIHRASNTDDRNKLTKIIKALSQLKLPTIFLMHPRTKKMIYKWNLKKLLVQSKVIISESKSYIESLSLQKFAKAVITDSGGVQREAYFLKRYCITLRENTEWPETVKSGWNTLWFPNEEPFEKILESAKIPKIHPSFFGNGHGGREIVKSIKSFLH